MIKIYGCKIGDNKEDSDRFIDILKYLRKMPNTKVYLVGDTCNDWQFVVDHKLDGIAASNAHELRKDC